MFVINNSFKAMTLVLCCGIFFSSSLYSSNCRAHVNENFENKDSEKMSITSKSTREHLKFDVLSDNTEKKTVLYSKYNMCYELYEKALLLDAYQPCLEMASNGDSYAQFIIGNFFYTHPINDYASAAKWWTIAAESGSVSAMYNMGVLYAKGLGVPKNLKQAELWWFKAAKKGDTLAVSDLGLLYLKGNKEFNIEQDTEEAIRLLHLSAEQGDSQGIVNLAYAYKYGVGVPKNEVEAFNLYSLAATNGYPKAMYELGMSYINGIGCEKNINKGFFWIKKAANSEFLEAYSILGNLYELGLGTPKKLQYAFLAYKNGANRGSSKSEYFLGLAYLNGIGTVQNTNKAIEHLEQALVKGYEIAKVKLAMIYLGSEYGVYDERKTLKILDEIITDPNVGKDVLAEAKYYLGTMLYFGIGVEKNKEKAKIVLKDSYVMGNSQAKSFFLKHFREYD
ncbi:MAG: hypothetical protein ACI4V7_06600 [Succinivibrionaceae bacterium]